MQTSNLKDIFINCPFDAQYLDMFRALVFTLLYTGYVPRCTLEVADSSQVRLDRIVRLIHDSPMAIHDISCVEPKREGKFPRFNMPFELGMFFGAKWFGGKHYEAKRCLIFECDRHDYDKCLSDISGCDPVPHFDDRLTMIRRVRTWLMRGVNADHEMRTAKSIDDSYKQFLTDFRESCTARGDLHRHMPYDDYTEFTKNVTEWLWVNRPR